MPARQIHHFLISYDIADPKRLAKIHRILKQKGLPVQYSVFSVLYTKKQLSALLLRLQSSMNEKEDDIRCYTLPQTIHCEMIGRQLFAEEVYLFNNGISRLLQ